VRRKRPAIEVFTGFAEASPSASHTQRPNKALQRTGEQLDPTGFGTLGRSAEPVGVRYPGR